MSLWNVWEQIPFVSYFTSSSAEVDDPLLKKRPALLLVGDSITQEGTNLGHNGWITLLQYRYNRSVDFVCRGLSGYNTKWYVEHISPVIELDLSSGLSPALITLWFGANDAALEDGPDKAQYVPISDYRANLQTILKSFKEKAPDAKVLVITPPAVNDDVRRALHGGKLDRSNAMTGQYAHACVEEATTAGVAVLDLYTFFNAMPVKERNSCLLDGLHFNAKGNGFVDEQIRAKIHSAFPELVPQLEKWRCPDWHDFVKN